MFLKKKKEKENKDMLLDPLEQCKLLFKENTKVNNRNIIASHGQSFIIKEIKEIGWFSGNEETITVRHKGGHNTLWKDGVFADIIPNHLNQDEHKYPF